MVESADRDPIDWAGLSRAPDPCLICGDVDHRLLYAPTFAGRTTELSDYFLANRKATAHGPIVRCRTCAFTFTSPRFTSAMYDEVYGSLTAPATQDAAFDLAKRARFSRLRDHVRRHCPSGGDFLDVGCGDGSFLRLMDDPRGKGFEVGPPSRRLIGRSEVVTGDWASFAGSEDCPPASFDFVTAFDVLEHLPDIEPAVAGIRTILKPGGVFFASVPDISSPVAGAMGKRWNMLLLEHLWYFSPETLRPLMTRNGFEEIEVRPVPFDAPLAHLITRLAQTFGMKGTVTPGPLSRVVLPVPAGIMLGVYRAV